MKKFFTMSLILFMTSFVFSQNSISDAINAFDKDFMNAESTKVKVTLGLITYENTDTAGTIVPFLQDDIKTAINDSFRLDLVKTIEFSEYGQHGVVTRGPNTGIKKNAEDIGKKEYTIDGHYYDRENWVELELKMYNSTEVFATHTARIEKSLITKNNLTIYPKNIKIAEEIRKDYEDADDEVNKNIKTPLSVQAAMVKNGNFVTCFLPGDENVSIMILKADTDCYIELLNIDANKEKNWLTRDKDCFPNQCIFLKAGENYELPTKFRVLPNSPIGAEQLIIYACTNKNGLPPQINEKYSNHDLHTIMKKQVAEKKNKKYRYGQFKITYTILER